MLWALIIIAIIVNGIFTLNFSFYTNFPSQTFLGNHDLYNLGQVLLSPVNSVPYSHYLLKKWSLVIMAFAVLIYWLVKNKFRFKNIKPHFPVFLLIFLSILVARFQSFQSWFWHDDYRLIKDYYVTSNHVSDPEYPLGIFFLVIRWFDTNFALYTALGLFFYFLSGILIYLISNLLQKRKYVSVLAAIFFVTSTGYFQEWLLMNNFTGNIFVLLLFLISLHLLLNKFLAGAIIFAAAALEFGIVRTHFIALYLALAGLLFTHNKPFSKKSLKQLGGFLLTSLVYLPLGLGYFVFSSGTVTPTLHHIQVLGNMWGEIATPYFVLTPLMNLLASLFNKSPNIPVIFGYFIILALGLTTWVFRKKKEVFKILLFGFFIFVTGIIVPALIGRRVHHDETKFLAYLISAPYPTITTAYSLFSVLGLTFFLVGVGNFLNHKIYKILIIVLIALNMAAYIKSDQTWINNYAYPQRKQNTQLEAILPRTTPLYIYIVPSTDPLLKHYQRHLWQGTRNFQLALRPKQKMNIYLDKKQFDLDLDKNKPTANQVYFLIEDLTYNIKNLPTPEIK